VTRCAANCAVVLVFLCAAARGAAQDGAEAGDGAPGAAVSDHLAGGRVVLQKGAAEKAGLVVVAAEAARSAAAQRAFGRVLDPLPFVDAVNAGAASRSALALARAEDERMTRLYGHDLNASAQDVERAHDALRRARLDTAGTAARLRSLWGEAADEEDLEALVDALGRGAGAIARVDQAPSPVGAEHALSALTTAEGAALTGARVLGRAPAVDPSLQGPGYLLWIDRDVPAVGSSLLATFTTAAPQSGALVPASAIVWCDGVPSVYVEVGEGAFERRAIADRLAAPGGWLILEGVRPGERVVTKGAQQLRSAEVLARD